MKFSRSLIIFIVVLFMSVFFGAIFYNQPRTVAPVDVEKRTTVETIPGSMKRPGDLTGDWVSEANENVKFVAEIYRGTILIHMNSANSTVAYYYGTWPDESDESNVFRSIKIDDPQKAILSSASTKDFLWRGDRISFNYKFGPVTTAIEMVREK